MDKKRLLELAGAPITEDFGGKKPTMSDEEFAKLRQDLKDATNHLMQLKSVFKKQTGQEYKYPERPKKGGM